MLSEARIRANRQNALRSTGPRTDAGKARTRQNALKHGLTGSGLVQPAEEAAKIERRSLEWDAGFRVQTAYQAWLFGQVVLASIRLDRCGKLDTAHRGLSAERAASCWDDDRRLAVEQLAVRLSKSPAAVVGQLRQTRQGCDWLIARWSALAESLARKSAWSDAERSLAFDLWGVPQLERDPGGSTPTPAGKLEELVLEEIANLQKIKARGLDELDATEQFLAEAGLRFDTDTPARLMRRYEAACRRTLEWGLTQLRKEQRDAKRLEADNDSYDDFEDPERAFQERATALSAMVERNRKSKPANQPTPPAAPPTAPSPPTARADRTYVAGTPSLSPALAPSPARLPAAAALLAPLVPLRAAAQPLAITVGSSPKASANAGPPPHRSRRARYALKMQANALS